MKDTDCWIRLVSFFLSGGEDYGFTLFGSRRYLDSYDKVVVLPTPIEYNLFMSPQDVDR